jgi:hypothetical protein
MPAETFRLASKLNVVKMRKDNEGEVFTLPAGAIIVVRSPSIVPGCLEIQYEGESYNVFEEDLRERSRTAGGLS